MDKVLSAIKSLECVDILKVNLKEDTEVALDAPKLKIQFKILIIAQKVMRKIANLPSIPILLLN